MRKLCHIGILLCIIAVMAGTGCTERKPAAVDSVAVDTIVSDSVPSDTLEVLLNEQPMPKAADELFDDFFFNYAANRKLQRERTDFPLTVDSYGKITMMKESRWSIERFFMKQGYYTLVFNNHKQMNIVKDTSVEHVTVERLNFERNIMQQWCFNRVEGLWRMQRMVHRSLNQHSDAGFLKFYNKFATDSVFQQESLAELVAVSAPDPDDDFSRMEGSVMPEQWPMFSPWMPSGVLYNIHYGSEPYKHSSERVFVIRGIANGIETELTFKRNGSSWQLVSMES